jgi:hypothetical protein
MGVTLRGLDHNARRPLADAVSAADVRTSLHGAPEELRGLLTGMLAVLELTREDFTHRRYVLFSAHGAEVLHGACSYHVTPSTGELRVVTDNGVRSRYCRRRQWRALGQLSCGVLRNVDFAPELLVVAVRPAKAKRA